MNKIEGLTLGSDPELMLFDKEQGKIVSAIPVLAKDKIPSDKKNPIDLGDGYKMYSDNVLVEMSMPPAEGADNFTSNVVFGLNKVRNYLGPRYDLVAKAAHLYEKAELQEPGAIEVGCNPSFNAYAQSMNLPAEFKTGMRTGSFHIHVGHPSIRDVNSQEEAIKIMDLFVGCASVIFDKDDTNIARRTLYGKAGEFRPTPYGIEYRVLGNWALRHRATTCLVADLTEHAIASRGQVDMKSLDNVVQRAINGHDKAEAQRVLIIAGLPANLMKRIHQNNEPIVVT